MSKEGMGMDEHPYRIYCAGPLFNPKEREEMAAIATVLEDTGYSVFLPQEHGLKFAELLPTLTKKNITVEDGAVMLNMAIFSLDVFEVVNSDGLILNMNGRVPDEGAMVESGIAWSHNKTVVIFKNDDRSLILGNCNPLVMGLSDFEFVDRYEDIPVAFERRLTETRKVVTSAFPLNCETTKKNGQKISDYLTQRRTYDEITDLLLKLFGGISCQISRGLKKNFPQTLGPPLVPKEGMDS
jgi:nucleoside 2-deoxyribosyltransferase